MIIDDILKQKGRNIFSVSEDEKICNVLEIFSEKKIGSVIVIGQDGKIAGIMTEKDVLKCFRDVEKFSEIQIKDIMTKFEDLVIASFDDDIQYAMSIMTEHRIKHLPIFKNTELYGMISIGDLIKAQLEHSKHVAKTYLDLIKGKTPQAENQEF
jgi:CBS domain-containing protein